MENNMSAYSVNLEIKDLLWGTPMPITTRLQMKWVTVLLKGSCSLIVADTALFREKLPDTDAMARSVRRILVNAAGDIVCHNTEISSRFSNVEQLAAEFAPELSNLIKIKAADELAGFGLKIRELEIHGIEDGGPAPL
jgi:hypothetical protein